LDSIDNATPDKPSLSLGSVAVIYLNWSSVLENGPSNIKTFALVGIGMNFNKRKCRSEGNLRVVTRWAEAAWICKGLKCKLKMK